MSGGDLPPENILLALATFSRDGIRRQLQRAQLNQNGNVDDFKLGDGNIFTSERESSRNGNIFLRHNRCYGTHNKSII